MGTRGATSKRVVRASSVPGVSRCLCTMDKGGWDHPGLLDDDDMMDDSNPFMEKPASPFASTASSTAPKDVPKAKMSKPVEYKATNKSGFGETSSAAFADEVASADEIRAKMEELEARERALEAREQEAGLIEQRNTPNYPPFPSFCCIKPWVYHNITDEIPQASWRRQKAYWAYWHFHWIVMTFNMLAAAVQMNLVSFVGLEGPLITLIFSFIYWIAFTYIGFYLLYRNLYRGVKEGSSFRLVLHLVCQGLHNCYAIYMAVGAMNTGGAGYIGAVDLFNRDHSVSGFICIISGVGWTLDCLGGCIFFYLHYTFFKANGHSFAEAQKQALSSAATNKTIQDATFTITETALRNKAAGNA